MAVRVGNSIKKIRTQHFHKIASPPLRKNTVFRSFHCKIWSSHPPVSLASRVLWAVGRFLKIAKIFFFVFDQMKFLSKSNVLENVYLFSNLINLIHNFLFVLADSAPMVVLERTCCLLHFLFHFCTLLHSYSMDRTRR